MNKFQFKAEVWVYPGMAGWHFISLPKTLTKKIDKIFGGLKAGWGSLPVTVTIGQTSWQTSIFPDKKSATYLLPLKAQVRKKEHIAKNDNVTVRLEIRI